MKPEHWKRIDEIFDAALELEPQERAAYLDEACAGDAALRKEVESLLAYDQKANDFIETPVLQTNPEILLANKSRFAAGQSLGPYTILSLLGAGGMGEVYLAEDTRLGRKVAIKALPAHLASDSDARRRFEREARLISKLSHPHICSIYDIGNQDNTDYLVMEYIEGETLADRLSQGAIPTEQVLLYAVQIADALDKAHRAGVIHRDLKPGNIMLTKSGAKLLDFGLAKLRNVGGILFSPSPASTAPETLTAKGTIIGTLQYMAPEQFDGQEADERTDIFAFGAILYEMLTGKKAFVGKSQASLIAAILTNEPQPISVLQPLTPPALEHTVKVCLAKDPDDRWQTVHDLKRQLQWIAKADSRAADTAPVTYQRLMSERFGWFAAAVCLVLAIAALTFAYFNRPSSSTVSTTRFTVPAPDKTSFAPISQAAISPDGRRLAFIAVADGKNSLWVRPLDSLAAQPLAGTEGANRPFWSQDGRFIGFFAQGKLKRIDSAGGSPQTLCDTVGEGGGGTWNGDGVILFSSQRLDVISRVPAVGGIPSPVTKLNLERHEYSHVWPHFLPDGRHFLYSVGAPQNEGGIYLGSLDGSEPRRLLAAESNAAYAAPGYLLFVRETTLLAQPFNADRLQLTGEPFPVAEQIWFTAISGYAAFSVSQNGVLTYEKGSNVNRQLIWFDRSGKELEKVGTPGEYQSIALSPDEKRVAVERHDPKTRNVDIWLLDMPRGIWSRLTSDPAWDYCPVWSSDGKNIVFGSIREGPGDLYQIPASNAGSEELLLKSSSGVIFPTQYAQSGQYLVYHQNELKTKRNLWILSLSGDRQPQPFMQTEFDEVQGALSPDGHWMAYVSDETGKPEIYVQPFPTTGSKWQISTGGGAQVRWRGDGKELFYIAADGKLTAVEISPGAEFKSGSPKALFPAAIEKIAGSRYHFAVTADGQRFLLNARVEDATPAPINVVLNWTADMKN